MTNSSAALFPPRLPNRIGSAPVRKRISLLISNKLLLGFVLGFIGVVIFGITLPMTRLAVAEIDPFAVSAGRATLAGLAALLAVLLTRRKIPIAHMGTIFWIGLLVIVGFPFMSALAMRTVPAAHGGIILALLPPATALAAVIVAREKPSLRFWLFSIAGAALVLLFALRDFDSDIAVGDLWLVAATACAALGYAFSGRLARKMPGWEIISWALVAWLPFSAIAMWLSDFPPVQILSSNVLVAFLYLGIFSQFLGFFAWNAGLGLGGVAKVGQIQLLQTFVTLFAAAWLLGETVDVTTILFAMAVALVVAMGRNAPVTRKAD